MKRKAQAFDRRSFKRKFEKLPPKVSIFHFGAEVLFAKYLECLADSKADESEDRIKLPDLKTPEELEAYLVGLLDETGIEEPHHFHQLRWEVMLLYGYRVRKIWQQTYLIPLLKSAIKTAVDKVFPKAFAEHPLIKHFGTRKKVVVKKPRLKKAMTAKKSSHKQ